MSAVLPFLFVAICPIAMILMMRGMHKHGSQAGGQAPNADTSLDIARLRQLRSDLESRMEALDTRIDELETTRAITNGTGAASSDWT